MSTGSKFILGILFSLNLRLSSILFVCVNLFVCVSALSQESKFNAGIIAGLNFSELEGAELTDYIGLNAGIIGTIKLSEKHQIGIEFLFSQNGEYIIPEFYPLIEYGQIRLNHLEIPIHFDWLITNKKRDKTYNINVNLGIAYVKLLNHSAKDINGIEVSNQIVFDKKDALHLQGGLTYKLAKHLGLNFKATVPIRVEDWTIAVRLIYMIN